MPLQNRVTPTSELIADPARGLVYGNRGCLHDERGRIRRRYNGKRWIACRLEFRGWRRSPLLQPGRFTELFFLDEATAFAAGHRPCALCRREDYVRFSEIWRELHPGQHGADAIDARLHSERLAGRAQRRHEARLDELPDGAFVLHGEEPHVVLGAHLLRWASGGYVERKPRPGGDVTLLTPPSLVAVLRAGWQPVVPLVHPAALVRIEGDRVVLRPLRMDELEASLAARRRQHEADVTTMPVVATPESLRERFARSGVMRDGAIDLAIEVGGVRLGEIQTFVPPGRTQRPGVFEVGIVVYDPAERGKGYGTEATGLMLDWLFAECGADRVNMPTSAGNAPMQAVLERLGFVRDGLVRAMGQEFVLYSVTRERWLG